MKQLQSIRFDAETACTPLIERRIKYDYEWDGLSWFESIFGQVNPSIDGTSGVQVFTGSKLRAQNAFGVWKRIRYRCEYNVDTGRVTGLEFSED